MNEPQQFDAFKFSRWLYEAISKSEFADAELPETDSFNRKDVELWLEGDDSDEPIPQPMVGTVDTLVKLLNADIDEARIAAGHRPKHVDLTADFKLMLNSEFNPIASDETEIAIDDEIKIVHKNRRKISDDQIKEISKILNPHLIESQILENFNANLPQNLETIGTQDEANETDLEKIKKRLDKE